MIICVIPIDVSNTCYNQCVKDGEATATSSANTLPTTAGASDNQSLGQLLPNFSESVSPTSSTPGSSIVIATTDIQVRTICKEPLSYVRDPVLSILWHVVYWTSQSLTWIILPMMQSYAKAGEFTVLGKLKYALIANAIYYGTYLLVFAICLIYLATKPGMYLDGPRLKVLAITASNTWGLFLLVLLLGYGLIELPRLCWLSSKRGFMLSRTRFKLAKLSLERIEAEEDLEDILSEVSRLNDTIQAPHPFRKYVDVILAKCPESLRNSISSPSSARSRSAFDRSDTPHEVPTERSLARLHRRLIVAIQRHGCTQCQWSKHMNAAMELEELAENQASVLKVYHRSSGVYSGWFRHCHSPSIEWYWKCWICPWTLRLLAVLMFAFSLMVIWSECLFFVKSPVLSLFAIFIDLARAHYNYVAVEFVCVLTIAYLSICAYYTIFKIRIFNYYYVVGNHQTDENSMIFCGMLLCRLTPPLCLNFLGLTHLDSHITKDSDTVETAYTKFMGHMDVISFISDGFNVYFPIAIVVLCFLTFFKVGTWLLHLLGFQQFIGDDEMTQELVDEGAELVKRELRKRQRSEESETRRRAWNERFAGRNTSGPDPDEGGRRRAVRTDNDRSELLREAEPMDYTRRCPDVSASAEEQLIPGLYQSDPVSRPKFLGSSQGFGPTTTLPTRPLDRKSVV